MKQKLLRSDCPINFSLEVLGDTWSLLIVRDIIYFGKRTYNEFLSSDEHIAPNILATRLKQLQDNGLLIKKPHPTDKRKEIYEPTDDCLNLIPILVELAAWGSNHVPQESLPHRWLSVVRRDRDKSIELVKATVKRGGSVFVGENSVVSQLDLHV